MSNRIEVGSLKIDEELYNLVRDEIVPGTGVDPDAFWESLGTIVSDLAPHNQELLQERDNLQSQIDAWYLENKDGGIDPASYRSFLTEIGYLENEGVHFEVTTTNGQSLRCALRD